MVGEDCWRAEGYWRGAAGLGAYHGAKAQSLYPLYAALKRFHVGAISCAMRA
jgi:hypothetical protein